ncbi:hypothetical protein M2459_000944 [Parabacteroides sp. PF5-5]|uniref:argonaute/piwi family protein n=1 Tax=unclassified Parabacteroides TaxID=2649774 RepID=UPI002476252D|nr:MULTISPECIES: hypothetical protein [unclassified Parabacteroides]MDH6304216.1 hypothetical protein [Parabacteroides sp. PH5-39]MDH6315069.1 hypothetical protein [Parabacteroides sp. PF5-13]MDH6318729.1 hypothetical protein [Parabacteroides sp. PH5-13]MDH6322459.1 hypothetical protein [Parabacteroides sp. PH5-8]MDH6326406.1 hypothetical protein [Parabacteroides sp. PH5-41]
MKYHFIEEPLLEFGKDEHFCPRQGIANYDVYDTKFTARKTEILIGIVGISEDVEKLNAWLERCKSFIPSKANTKQPQLFTSFCGFNENTGFRSKFITSTEITRVINNTDIREILKIKNRNECVTQAVELFSDHIRFIAQNKLVDLIVCIVPKSFENKIVIEKKTEEEIEERLDAEEKPELEINFRRALKASTMFLGKPLQLIREYSLSNPSKGQDEATKAWNFCTALYYKAMQTVPWKLKRDINLPMVCYVGISFYRSRDKKSIQTSLAQIFNEKGNGVILRGTPVEIDKKDRQPHLSDKQAYDLLLSALKEYKFALDTQPARLVLHKSSKYSIDELDGFRKAINDAGISSYDFVTIKETDIRFFRDGFYPPQRGSMFSLSETSHILYTRGSVDYYKTYPGLYIPSPLEIRTVEFDSSPNVICEEVLALSKMNWNNTQFDGKYPITIACARKVGEIMKYLSEADKPQIRYAFYM